MNIVGSVWLFAGLVILATLFVMAVLAKMYRKAGPHEALIIYGTGGTRIVKGSGTMICPMVQTSGICRWS